MDGGDPGGGSRELVRLIDEFGWYLVPDMLSTYGVDLRDLVSDEGELSPRRALSLISGLPPGTATWARLAGEEDLAGWDTQTFLLAGLIDSVRENTFATVQVNSKKRLKQPEPFPVPGSKKKKRPEQNMFAAMAAAQLRARKDK